MTTKTIAAPIKASSPAAINRTARIAGLLYLAHFVAFFIADNGVHYTAVGPLTAATAGQIMTSEWLFRIGFVSFLLAALFFLSAAWALYVLLESVNKQLALLFLLLNLAGVVVQCASLSSEFGAYLMLGGPDYVQALPPEASQATGMLLLSMYKSGFMSAQIFLALWVLPLGYLVIRSEYLPKLLGAFLVVDCLVLLVWVFQFFLVHPENEAVSGVCLAISFVAEASLCLWLLIMGVNVKQWEKHVVGIA